MHDKPLQTTAFLRVKAECQETHAEHMRIMSHWHINHLLDCTTDGNVALSALGEPDATLEDYDNARRFGGWQPSVIFTHFILPPPPPGLYDGDAQAVALRDARHADVDKMAEGAAAYAARHGSAGLRSLAAHLLPLRQTLRGKQAALDTFTNTARAAVEARERATQKELEFV